MKEVKIKELRIGNIINHITGPIVVDVDDFSLIKNDPCEYSGVYLTTSWLFAFGFPYENVFHILNGQWVLEQDGQWIGGFEDNEFGLDEKNEIKIQYVHQLQNLFFALTGKELTRNNAINNT